MVGSQLFKLDSISEPASTNSPQEQTKNTSDQESTLRASSPPRNVPHDDSSTKRKDVDAIKAKKGPESSDSPSITPAQFVASSVATEQSPKAASSRTELRKRLTPMRAQNCQPFERITKCKCFLDNIQRNRHVLFDGI